MTDDAFDLYATTTAAAAQVPNALYSYNGAVSYYGGIISEDAAEQLEQAVMRIKEGLAKQADAIVIIGEALQFVKATLPHGAWRRWLQREFCLSERTAENYMRVATAFRANPKCVANLPLATVYRLSAPSTPEFIREEVRNGTLTHPLDIADRIGRYASAARIQAPATEDNGSPAADDACRADRVVPEAMDLIRGTKLDTGTYLDKLKRLPPNEQMAKVRRDIESGASPRAPRAVNKTVAAPESPPRLAGDADDEDDVAAAIGEAAELVALGLTAADAAKMVELLSGPLANIWCSQLADAVRKAI